MLNSEAEAEDVAQEVFVQVFRAIDQFRGDSKLSTWVFRIAINLAKNRTLYLQRRHSDAKAINEDVHEIGERVSLSTAIAGTSANVPRPDDLYEGMTVERIVQAAIAGLEDSFRECLVLREVEDLSYDEIATITGLPVGTVKSRIHRARAEVRLFVESALGEKVGGKVARNSGETSAKKPKEDESEGE
jgi:RNA polymerase sigma-70 factor (ECF subfamily)